MRTISLGHTRYGQYVHFFPTDRMFRPTQASCKRIERLLEPIKPKFLYFDWDGFSAAYELSERAKRVTA